MSAAILLNRVPQAVFSKKSIRFGRNQFRRPDPFNSAAADYDPVSGYHPCLTSLLLICACCSESSSMIRSRAGATPTMAGSAAVFGRDRA